MAGGTALFAIVALMPSAFYNLDLIAGAHNNWQGLPCSCRRTCRLLLQPQVAAVLEKEKRALGLN